MRSNSLAITANTQVTHRSRRRRRRTSRLFKPATVVGDRPGCSPSVPSSSRRYDRPHTTAAFPTFPTRGWCRNAVCPGIVSVLVCELIHIPASPRGIARGSSDSRCPADGSRSSSRSRRGESGPSCLSVCFACPLAVSLCLCSLSLSLSLSVSLCLCLSVCLAYPIAPSPTLYLCLCYLSVIYRPLRNYLSSREKRTVRTSFLGEDCRGQRRYRVVSYVTRRVEKLRVDPR